MADWKREAEAQQPAPGTTSPWKCPTCRTINEGMATFCDCGYNRATNTRVNPTRETERISLRDGAIARADLAHRYRTQLMQGLVVFTFGLYVWVSTLSGQMTAYNDIRMGVLGRDSRGVH